MQQQGNSKSITGRESISSKQQLGRADLTSTRSGHATSTQAYSHVDDKVHDAYSKIKITSNASKGRVTTQNVTRFPFICQAGFLGPVFARVHMHRCARFAKIRPYSKISDEAFLLLYAVFLATWLQRGPKMLSGRARAHARAQSQMRAFSRTS